MIEDLSNLTPEEIEDIEKLTLRWICQAMVDFGADAYNVFWLSPDKPGDIAEDVTREVLDNLPGFNIHERIFGTVDYRKARYIILPDQTIRQALFVDSKAEKASQTATLQMSQISLSVRQRRSGKAVEVDGTLPPILQVAGGDYLVTTMLLHFQYGESSGKHRLERVRLCAIPNAKLQEQYNPTAEDSIWLVGRNAPSRGEDFRVRLSFKRLRAKMLWRVQEMTYDPKGPTCNFQWEE